MWTRVSLVGSLTVVSALLLASAPRAMPRAADHSGEAHDARTVVPGASLPTARVHHYRLSGRIRPLLIWMGRDDVGLGRVTWREGEEGARGYELLIGTDPARAPRAMNRWGFVAEAHGPHGGDLLAFMTGLAFGSFAEAKSDVSKQHQAGHIRALRGRLEGGLATGQVLQVMLDHTPTVHDASVVLERLAAEPQSSAPVSARVTPAARPGLLTALADTLERMVSTARDPRASVDTLIGPAVPYTFGRDSYELRVRRAKRTEVSPGTPAAAHAVEAEFEILTLSTGTRTRFQLSCGIDGALAGVPLEVRWQPRWWLEIGLHLTE